MNRLCLPWLHIRLKMVLFEYISILPVVEFPIAASTALQSNVMCNKLNLLLRAQELGIDDPVLLRLISYSWKLLRSAYLLKNLWLWYELVRAEKSLMTCKELTKCICSFCMFNWTHSRAHVGAAWPTHVCSFAWKPCSLSDRFGLIPTHADWREVNSKLENQVSVGECHPKPAHSWAHSQDYGM